MLGTVLCLTALTPRLQAQNSEIALKIGDQISLQISGIPPEEVSQISHNYRVSDQGTISLLYLNEVQASGMKPSELERKIVSLYKGQEIYTHPTVTVNVDTTGIERVVTVGGAVTKPGPIPYRPGLTAGAALDSAGGATPFGKLRETKLIRSGKEFVLDLRKAANRDSETAMEPGDRLVVPD